MVNEMLSAQPTVRRCSRCVMDSSASDISFVIEGCNFCSEFISRSSHIIHEDSEIKSKRLMSFVDQVKRDGLRKPYNAIVGVSGGVDSSWALVRAVELGLRPLAVHMDNGWNSELAQNNISNLVKTLNVDLYTYVIDWEEYRQLMQSFFDADVLDVELLYDNAMLSVCYQQARLYGIKYILSGSNQATEGMLMPSGWNWYKRDVRNIKAISWIFGGKKLSTFPTHSTLDYVFDEVVRGIHWIPFLDYFVYNKFDVVNSLVDRFGYKPYPYKHYESVFTRFYQGFILPNKFGVDKRLLHLSTLVASNQLSRDNALDQLNGSPYPSLRDLEIDTEYFLKKMGWSHEMLDSYIKRPEISHDFYPSEISFYQSLLRISKSSLISLLLSRIFRK